MKNILHTEASEGWGGQEIRILEESKGMREKGYEIFFAVQKKGKLIKQARQEGFVVYEINFSKRSSLSSFFQLCKIIKHHKIETINTHSSLDAWIAGFAGRFMGCRLIRTRHLSTSIKGGLNRKILYGYLADAVMTTCQEVADLVKKQTGLETCHSIPTGIRPENLIIDHKKVLDWKEKWKIKPQDCVVGTLCVIRSWKGISDLLLAAKELEKAQHIKWVIIGGGPGEEYFRKMCSDLQLDKVIFTGHLDYPFEALAALDIFLLLSTNHEGISQASLQAALLKKPLITTRTGGLKEICLPDKTGILVDTFSPKEVAQAVFHLAQHDNLRFQWGNHAHQMVLEKFTFEKMINKIETIYQLLSLKKNRK